MTTTPSGHETLTPGPRRRVDDPGFLARLDELIAECGGDAESFEGRMIREQLLTSLKLITDGRGTGELKLLTAAFKELRYAYNIFAQYHEPMKISIFGSARTPKEHPDYAAAVAVWFDEGERSARRMFAFSILYLFLLFAVLGLDRAPGLAATLAGGAG